MKKSALISFIKEEILSVLKEASDEDIQKQKEFNDELEKTNALMSKMTNEEKDELSEAREYDADDMEALGFDLYPGGRIEAFKYATEELGVPADEILGKISDDVIYNAIHHSLQVMDMYPIDEKVNEEEDAPAGDAEVEKVASKQDKIIKDFKNIEAKMKTHLELYKTSESSKNKEAAKNMLKKLTPEYQAAKEKYEKLKKIK